MKLVSQRGLLLAWSFGVAVVAAAACGGADRSFGSEAPEFGGTDAEPPPPSPGACVDPSLHCSRDLKQVLRRCGGIDTVYAECAADQGCADNICVDACKAAEFSKGSAGCEFWTVAPDDYFGSCYAAILANTWDRPVRVSVEFDGAALDNSKSIVTASTTAAGVTYTPVTGPLPPGEVALIFLSQASGGMTMCPTDVTPALADPPPLSRTNIAKAFHLVTDAPVSAYSIYPYGGAPTNFPTATLLLPVSSWDKDNVALTARPSTVLGSGSTSAPFLQVVASEDDTEVRITPVQDITQGTKVPASLKGTETTFRLARGEVLQLNQKADLLGSPVRANKPVGLFGGSTCTYIPSDTQACDVLQQQVPPLSQWGSEYAMVPYGPRIGTPVDRAEKVPYRLVGAVDGTALSYDPQRPGGAPATLAAGQTAEFTTDELFVVKSQDAQHPFYANVYMTGADAVGGKYMGDPDFVNVVASDQFLDRYVFFTDFTYPETTLTVVRRRTATGFADVELACGGTIGNFRPLGTSGEYEYAWLPLTRDSNPQTVPGGNGKSCGYGRHEARSDGPFSVTVWGMAYCSSYGYAGGTGLRPLNAIPPSLPR